MKINKIRTIFTWTFRTKQRHESSALLIRVTIGSESRLEVQAILPLEEHHEEVFVIDLEAAQNSFDFCQTVNGSVLCYDTVPTEFFNKIINIEDGAECFVQAQLKERETSPTKKSGRDHNTLKETSAHKSQDQEPWQPRLLGEVFGFAEFFERTKTGQFTFNVFAWCSKNNRTDKVLQDVVRSLAANQNYRKGMPK